MSLQLYLGKFEINADNNSFTANTIPIELDVGYYFIAGYQSADVQLTQHLQAKLITAGFSASVFYTGSTGKITINFGTTTDVVWTDVNLRNLLGFTGDLSGASVYVAPNMPRYVWRPSNNPASFPTSLDNWFRPRSTTRSIRSNTGTTAAIRGNLLYDTEIKYELLNYTEVYKHTALDYNNFEQFFEDVIHGGFDIRALPNRLDYNSADDFHTCTIATDDEVGTFSDFAERSVTRQNSLWGVELDFWKKI